MSATDPTASATASVEDSPVVGLADDRRGLDRRRRHVFRHPERRLGFDRRLPAHPASAAAEGTLRFLRDSDVALASTLVLLNVLNVTDLLLTLYLLPRGASEANVVIEALLSTHPLSAALFKVVVVALASTVIWKMRRYRAILALGVFAVAVFLVLTVYELAMLAAVS